MSDDRPQPALREWRRHIQQPATLAALVGTAAVLALAGPFGTDERLGLVPGFVYWLAICFPTYGLGVLVSILLERRLATASRALHIGAQAVATGLGVTVLVSLVNLAAFGWFPGPAELPVFLATIFAIALIVTVVLHVVQSHGAGTDTPPAVRPTPPPILERLPFDKRGGLLALSVEDHYVRVRTTVGEELLLMRLSDAIRETGDLPGARVHRSHWVAFAAVKTARRVGDRAILTLGDGSEVPVSRANVPAIKEAGLLPR